LVLIAVGVLAAMATPRLMKSIESARQKRTLARMRTVGSAIEAYALDHSDWKPLVRDRSPAALSALLVPKYTKEIETDAWQRPLHLALARPNGILDYKVWSYGRDGKPDAKKVKYTTTADGDIVFDNGTFTVYPEGM
jgi:type II secretory pathway pseudopilin PulG